MDVSPLAFWINEREAIRMRKAILEDAAERGRLVLSKHGKLVWGTPSTKPNSAGQYFWSPDYLTHDYVLRENRFCSVRREDDRVTRWIREHIIVPNWDHPNLWLMLCIARTINWPDTLAELIASPDAWPADSRFCPERLTWVLQTRKDRGEKVYTGAYMIRAESVPSVPWYSWSKQRYIAEVVIGKLWENRHDWQHLDTDGTQQAQGVWEYLQMFTGWGPFMAGQVVTDLKHSRYLENCEDFNTWTALGPGSTRGLNRLHGRMVGKPVNQAQGLAEMVEIREALNQQGVIWPWLQPMELSDVQNCLCEFDKYQRVSLGQGKTRARYVPGRGY